MEKITKDHPTARSADIVADNIQRLKELFPEAVTEGRIDFEVLRQLLGDEVDERDEKYGLNWNGKRRARQLALTPSLGTLRPCPEESVDWDTTKNIFIEGDNLEVLKLLRKSFAGRVKLIYIDPPYNTGNDLVYPNDYSDPLATYLEVTGQREGEGKLVANPESSGRYHTTWLSMMYPRLILARQLLRKDGVLICTIDENEQDNLSLVLKDVFNEGTYEHVCVTIVHNPRGVQGSNFSYTHEYAIFVYPRGQKAIGQRTIEPEDVTWSHLRNWGGESERSDAKNCFYPIIVEDGKIVGFGDVVPDDVHPQQTEVRGRKSYVYPIDRAGVERKWRYARQSVESIAHLLRARKTDYGYEIEIGKNFGLYKTVWSDTRYDANEYGTKIVNSLVPDSPFSFPKSLWNVYDSINAVVGDDQEAIVMDFFAGSGTTGHAVWELNKQDAGNRRFVLVQLPEPIASNKIYTTIADVTKCRLKSASEDFSSELLPKCDFGFRVFKLDSSNIRAWNGEDDDVEGQLDLHINHLVDGRKEQDVLYELLLKLGLDLCVPIEKREVGREKLEGKGYTVHSVGGGVLMVCLATSIPTAHVEALGQGIVAWHGEQAPEGETQVVFRDSAFEDDVAKTNMTAILEQNGIKTVRSL